MKEPATGIVEEFAQKFAQKGRGKGFTQRELYEYFGRYSNSVALPDGPLPSKHDIFINSLRQLAPEDQFRALIDLCIDPPNIQNILPSEEDRNYLFQKLHSNGCNDGLCLGAIDLSFWDIRREWLKAVSRIEDNPDSAITSARTTLETTCKKILYEEGTAESDTKEPDLGKLVKMTTKSLKLEHGNEIIASGVASLLNGVAQQSNLVGDRHGTSVKYDISLNEARLACNICFSFTLFLMNHYQVHRDNKKDKKSSIE